MAEATPGATGGEALEAGDAVGDDGSRPFGSAAEPSAFSAWLALSFFSAAAFALFFRPAAFVLPDCPLSTPRRDPIELMAFPFPSAGYTLSFSAMRIVARRMAPLLKGSGVAGRRRLRSFKRMATFYISICRGLLRRSSGRLSVCGPS